MLTVLDDAHYVMEVEHDLSRQRNKRDPFVALKKLYWRNGKTHTERIKDTIGTDIRLSTKNSKSAVCENVNNTGHYLLWDEV